MVGLLLQVYEQELHEYTVGPGLLTGTIFEGFGAELLRMWLRERKAAVNSLRNGNNILRCGFAKLD